MSLTLGGADGSNFMKFGDNTSTIDQALSLFVLNGELYYRETLTGGTNLVTQITNNGALNVGALSFTLQDAYEDGNTITTSAAEGDLTVTGDQDFIIGGSVDVTFSTTGALNQSGNGQVTFTGNVDANGGLDVTGNLTVATGTVAIMANGVSSFATSAGALTLTSAAPATWSTSTGALSLQGASNISVAAASGDVSMVASADVVLDAAGEIVTETDLVADGVIADGDMLSVSSTGKLVPADANNHTHIAGAAAAAAADAAAVKLAGMPGSRVKVSTDISGLANGQVVYLSETAGAVTGTPPSTSGAKVIRAGIIVDKGTGAGDGYILFQPQFMYEVA